MAGPSVLFNMMQPPIHSALYPTPVLYVDLWIDFWKLRSPHYAPAMDPIDTLAMLDLQRRYADAVSRRAWDELGSLLTADCRVELALSGGDRAIEGAAQLVEFVSGAVSRFDTFVVAVLNAVVGPGPTGRMWIHELRWVDGEHTTAYGLYEDTFARDENGRWRIATRRYTSISGGRFRP